ncbi:MAG TPA: methylmalonyl Co-A mutase-associated GTPase MeaB [Terriglobia bacterium]|nr:methylmalonyl Co-A mutase-associated GTPase MeaB [Terriglobia bacterium]
MDLSVTNDLLENLMRGDIRSLARAITLVENRSPDGLELLRRLFPQTGRSRIIGITGSPGAGKSSLVDRLAALYRKQNQSLAIIAIDPSSPFTGGAVLGDRIRMNALATDPGVFIRSMATRGHLGGLAVATADVVSVLDAASRDPILVETVGVGQDEIDIVKLADVSVVVLVPGMGDDIQALKAGIMEIGDVFVINKCDRPGVEKMEHAIQTLLSLAHRPDGWVPPIIKTVAIEDRGTEELAETIQRTYEQFQTGEQRLQKLRAAARQRLLGLLQERLVRKAMDTAFPNDAMDRIVDQIAQRESDPYSIVEDLVRRARFEA